jgi:non-homologous end joining protein Ku
MYDSKKSKIVMTGEKEELFSIKHIIEEMEQQQSNSKHMDNLRKEYLKLIMARGVKKKEATEFLKERIPGI